MTTAGEALHVALVALSARDQPPPCVMARAPDPCSEDPDEREAAAYRCMRCPVRRECGDFGAEVNASWGVWGGTDRSAQVARPRKRRDSA